MRRSVNDHGGLGNERHTKVHFKGGYHLLESFKTKSLEGAKFTAISVSVVRGISGGALLRGRVGRRGIRWGISRVLSLYFDVVVAVFLLSLKLTFVVLLSGILQRLFVQYFEELYCVEVAVPRSPVLLVFLWRENGYGIT